MAEHSWLDHSTLVFPLAAATTLLTGDENAAGDMDVLTDIFAEESITGLTYDTDSSMVSLRAAASQDWGSAIEIDNLITTLAPICPDGTYCELESTFDGGSPAYRLIVSDDTVIEDYPNITWDDPNSIARGEMLVDTSHTLSTRPTIDGIPHELVATYKTKTIGEQDPYVSVTAELYELTDTGRRRSAEPVMCGQLHDLLDRYLPILTPLISVHLNNALTGEPMHAEANAWYWYTTTDTSSMPPDYARLDAAGRAAAYLGCSPEVFAHVDGDRAAFTAAVDSLRSLWKQQMDALLGLYKLR